MDFLKNSKDRLIKKEKLKQLKIRLLALSLCLTLTGCNQQNDKSEKAKETAIFFINGKALIYEEKEYFTTFDKDYFSISTSEIKYENITTFSRGVEAIKVQSIEDAIELATAIVGEENIIYINYNNKDMNLTYSKKK